MSALALFLALALQGVSSTSSGALTLWGGTLSPCAQESDCLVEGEICCDYYDEGDPGAERIKSDIWLDVAGLKARQVRRWPLRCVNSTISTCRRHWCECDNDCASLPGGNHHCCDGRCTTLFDAPASLPLCETSDDCIVAPFIACNTTSSTCYSPDHDDQSEALHYTGTYLKTCAADSDGEYYEDPWDLCPARSSSVAPGASSGVVIAAALATMSAFAIFGL